MTLRIIPYHRNEKIEIQNACISQYLFIFHTYKDAAYRIVANHSGEDEILGSNTVNTSLQTFLRKFKSV
jgi:hypothetical protein